MKYDWIEIALENGGVLSASRNVRGITATMNWLHSDAVRGEHHSAFPDALTSLNDALLEDASNESRNNEVPIALMPLIEPPVYPNGPTPIIGIRVHD
jgi:hypothetical protein